MLVKNRKTIWNLSLRSFRASGKRNLIAAAAIILTTVLFYLSFYHCPVFECQLSDPIPSGRSAVMPMEPSRM